MQSKVAPLLPLNINTPGVKGMTSRASMTGDVGDWLLTAQNAIYDRDGKIAPRPLFRKLYTTSLPAETRMYGTACPDDRSFYTFGTSDIYYLTPGLAFVKLASLPSGAVAPGDALGAGNWQAASLAGKNYFFHKLHQAKVHDINAGTFSDVAEAPMAGVVHSAFGRLWVATGAFGAQTLQWSGLLLGEDWNGAGTGSLLLQQYMTAGEFITAISDFNDYLIVFTNRQILIFQDPFTVPVDNVGAAGTAATMTLKDRIDGVGCIGRKLVVNVGEELIFLSTNGLQKLSKVVAEGGSNPVSEVTLHIEGGLNAQITLALNSSSDFANYEPELTWHPYHGFLFLNIINLTLELPQYLIWLNKKTETGYCVTTWGGRQDTGATSEGIIGPQSTSTSPVIRGWLRTGLSDNYPTDIGGLGAPLEVGYHGPFSWGQGAYHYTQNPHVEKYTYKLVSPWLSFGQQSETFIKILKRVLLAYRTASDPYSAGQYDNYTAEALDVTFKLRYDFGTESRDITFTAPLVSPGFQASYTPMVPHRITTLPVAGSGSLVQYEITAEISNPSHETFSVQRLSFQAKLGRVHQGI